MKGIKLPDLSKKKQNLTLIKISVAIASLHLGAELVPQAMQLPLEGIEARHCGLKEARLNDAHVDSKVVDVSPLKEKQKHLPVCC